MDVTDDYDNSTGRFAIGFDPACRTVHHRSPIPTPPQKKMCVGSFYLHGCLVSQIFFSRTLSAFV